MFFSARIALILSCHLWSVSSTIPSSISFNSKRRKLNKKILFIKLTNIQRHKIIRSIISQKKEHKVCTIQKVSLHLHRVWEKTSFQKRKFGWVAETSSLLNCRTGNRSGGSNPPASATRLKEGIQLNLHSRSQRGCLKINLRWPLLFHLRLDSFEFF